MPSVRFLTRADLDEYLAAGDPLANYLGQVDSTSERWLCESAPKRMIAWKLYGDLLMGMGKRVADIGSGYSSIQKTLDERHDYFPFDLGAHDSVGIYESDWRVVSRWNWDLVIANDLFPNVDQGLEPFLEKFSRYPFRLSLTTYPDRYYRVKRVDADELLTVRAWDWPQTQAVLLRYMQVPDISPPTESLFDNGRQVCLVV